MQNRKQCLSLIVITICFAVHNAVNVNVSCYDPSNECLQESKSLQTCLLSNNANICYINEGRYGMNISIANAHGNINQQIIISGKSDINSNTIIDGTVEIDSILSNTNNKWEKYVNNYNNKTCIYRIQLSHPIWQLFVDDEMMIPARWPNALWSDKSVFNWSIAQAVSSKNSTIGLMIDNGKKYFKNIPFNLTNNATAILNIGSWLTVSSSVTKHMPYSNNFSYYVQPEWPSKLHFQPQFCRYYLENNINFLDQQTEWFMDTQSNYLYLSPSQCKDPNTFDSIRGKINTYSLYVTDSTYLSFKNMTLFSTAFNVVHSSNITFENIIFNYSSYSKRAIGHSNEPPKSSIFSNGNHLSVINCVFYGGDGAAIDYSYSSKYGTFYNNLFEYTSYSCIGTNNNATSPGLTGSIYGGFQDTFMYNTVRNYGPSEGYVPSRFSNVSMNEFYGGSSLQDDGSCIQIGAKNINGSVYYKNWAYNTNKRAYRFDRANIPNVTSMGYNGTMSHLIGFNTGGMSVKGNNHKIMNNIIFNTTGKWNPLVPNPSYEPDIFILSYDPKCSYCIPGENNMTITENNGAVNFSGQSNTPYTVSGIFVNDISGNVINELVNPDQFDFRPKNGSVYAKNYIGPYLINDTFYWIPGRQKAKASFPIVSMQYEYDKIDLMWRSGYNAQFHKIKVFSKQNDAPIIDEKVMETNIWSLYGLKSINISDLLWRVDAIDYYGNENIGDVWQL